MLPKLQINNDEETKSSNFTYDINKSFSENIHTGPIFNGEIPQRTWPDQRYWHDFLGYQVASKIGIAACAITTSKWIELYSTLGFDIFTYKTIRSSFHEAYKNPNIFFINSNLDITKEMIGSKIYSDANSNKDMDISITNSFGNASFDSEFLKKDIAKSRTCLRKGQLLIVSVYGTNNQSRSTEEDFVYTAQMAIDSGAQIIEANLSCPNLKQKHPVYLDEKELFQITKALSKSIGQIPLIIKVGVFNDIKLMRKVLIAAARAGAAGICGINSVAMQVINSSNKPIFDENRKISGVSGATIQNLALDFIKNVDKINKEEKLNLTILGTGGVTRPEHFDLFLNAGSSIAMSATGAMHNPYLAIEYHILKNQILNMSDSYVLKRNKISNFNFSKNFSIKFCIKCQDKLDQISSNAQSQCRQVDICSLINHL